MDFQNAINTIVQELQSMIKKMLSRADYDKTYTGVVVGVTQRTNSSPYTYTVRINGVDREVNSILRYNVNDYVYVLVMRNNWNNLRLLPIEYEGNN